MPFLGCFRPSLSRSRLNRSRSSARSIEIDGCAEDGRAGLLDDVGELQGRLAAELHDHALERPVLPLLVEDGEHVLGGQRLEIKPVRRIVIGRHRLGVAVDHDRFVADLAQREGGVAAAIVELDPLPDPVRAAAKDHDLLAVGRSGLATGPAGEGRLVSRVHVSRGRCEFGRAGVDALVDRQHAEPPPSLRHV